MVYKNRRMLGSFKFKATGWVKRLYQLLVVLVAFFILLDMTIFLSISLSPYLFGIILIYIILLPLMTLIRHKQTYLAVLPIPCLGSWAISIIYYSSFDIPVLETSILVSIIPIVFVTLVHFVSRSRNVLFRAPMASWSRSWFGMASSVFFLVVPFVLGPRTLTMQPFLGIIYYLVLLLAYIMSSMLYVNSMYRYRIMCDKLGASSIERKMVKVWKTIEEKFSEKQKDVDLLRYYFGDALRLFEEGAYEESFISCYKTICEETIVNPKDYVSDIREGEPASFSEIRTILMHSRRKEIQIDLDKIRLTKRRLPQYCLELLQRAFSFLELLAIEQSVR